MLRTGTVFFCILHPFRTFIKFSFQEKCLTVQRLDDICEDGIALVGKIVEMYRYYGYTTQVLAASIRHTAHIMQCIEVGADVATCPLSAIKGLLNHPLTDSGLKKFLEDYKRVNG